MAWGALNPKAAERRKASDLLQARAAWVFAADLASAAFGADVRVVMQTRGTVGRGSHDEATTTARKVACYLALVVANATGARLAEAAKMDRATIHVHAAWVEDRRDDPEFDAKVAGLEAALFGMAARIVLAQLGQGLPEAQADAA